MIETKVLIAADLIPLISHLWKGGVLGIGPGNDIHLRDTLFHETFPEAKWPTIQVENGDWVFERYVNIDGKNIRFFCLHEKEAWDDV